jgi:glutamate-1-semialdehyde 2,1-aminomutase
MPGGVSSPVRAFKAVGGTPLFIREAEGCYVTDIDGNRYIDYVGSYGPMIVGHAHERVVAALSKAIGRGTSYGAPTEAETALASKIIAAIPSIEMVRFVNSGTEAAMSAIRLARAATGRDKIIKCIGNYHGHVDGLLVDAGSGALTLGHPSSPGVTQGTVSSTIGVPYNDLPAAKLAMEAHAGQIACFIVEPVAGNMGVVPPRPGYLQGLRDLCDQFGALLILDEVMTGFRVAWGGAQVAFNVRPDLTMLGKIVGGGLPCAAYAGPKKLMEQLSPVGQVYQAGTLSGNPLAMAAGLATLEILQEPGAYEALEERSNALADGLRASAKKAGVPVTITRVASMLGLFFSAEPDQPIANFADATACSTARYALFFNAMLDSGIYLAPGMYEALFVGIAHTPNIIDQTLEAAEKAFETVAKA